MSPEQIVHRLKQEQLAHAVSHEWIYRLIVADQRAGGGLYRCLRHRRKRYASYDRRGQRRNRVSVSERPAKAESRERLGDWEGDTVHGVGGHLVTLVGRKSGYLRAYPLKRRTRRQVIRAINLLLRGHAVHSLYRGERCTYVLNAGGEMFSEAVVSGCRIFSGLSRLFQRMLELSGQHELHEHHAEGDHQMRKTSSVAALFLYFGLFASNAMAHQDAGGMGGFLSGFMHPVLGWDHVIAMVAVGLWGAFIGGSAIWILPVVFPFVMTIGGALGVAGVPLPAVESGIAASAIVLGLMVAAAIKPPLWLAAVIVGVFAIFHGHAHGTELPGAVSALTYSMGFVVATGLLHLCGIAFGNLTRWPLGSLAVRAGGMVIGLCGVGFLTGAL